MMEAVGMLGGGRGKNSQEILGEGLGSRRSGHYVGSMVAICIAPGIAAQDPVEIENPFTKCIAGDRKGRDCLDILHSVLAALAFIGD